MLRVWPYPPDLALRPPRPSKPYRVVIRRVGLRWVWECGLCHPAVLGGTGSWERTMGNVARHQHNRRYHHEWTIRTHAWGRNI